MPKVVVITGPNHGFDKSAPIIADALTRDGRVEVTLTGDKTLLASDALGEYDVLVLGTGFTRSERQADGTILRLPDLLPGEEAGVLEFVRDGGGFVGIHGTGWWIGGECVTLVGGHANWHPPGLEFSVRIDDTTHPITSGVSDFTVQDEIYMSAWDPSIQVLATAEWAERRHPMAWVHRFGEGRVFYTTLGHGPSTFENPAMQHLLANAAAWTSGH